MISSRIVAGSLAFLLMSTAVHAASGMPRLGLQLSGAGTRVTLDPSAQGPEGSHHWRADFGAGLTADRPMTSRWAVTGGLRYLRTSEHESGSLTLVDPVSAYGTYDLRQRWHWLALPLAARWRPLAGLPLFVEAGGETRFLLLARTRSEARITPSPLASSRLSPAPAAQIFENVPNGEWYTSTSAFRRWDLALGGGIGGGFVWRGHPMTVRAVFTQGLADLARDAADRRRTQLAELGVGWGFAPSARSR